MVLMLFFYPGGMIYDGKYTGLEVIESQIKNFMAICFEQLLSLPDELYFLSHRVKIIVQGWCEAQITSCTCKTALYTVTALC